MTRTEEVFISSALGSVFYALRKLTFTLCSPSFPSVPFCLEDFKKSKDDFHISVIYGLILMIFGSKPIFSTMNLNHVCSACFSHHFESSWISISQKLTRAMTIFEHPKLLEIQQSFRSNPLLFLTSLNCASFCKSRTKLLQYRHF